MADVLSSVCRASDVAARLGGDEFVLLAFDAGPADIAALSERLAPDSVHGTRAGPRSIGWAAYLPCSGESLEDLLHRADVAMYAHRTQRHAQH